MPAPRIEALARDRTAIISDLVAVQSNDNVTGHLVGALTGFSRFRRHNSSIIGPYLIFETQSKQDGSSGMKRVLVGAAIASAFLLAQPSAAQSSRLKPFSVGGKSSKNVTVSVSYQFFMAGETKSVSDQASLADQGRRHLYMLLAKECEVLLETICVGLPDEPGQREHAARQRNRSTREGVRVSGSATYQIN